VTLIVLNRCFSNCGPRTKRIPRRLWRRSAAAFWKY